MPEFVNKLYNFLFRIHFQGLTKIHKIRNAVRMAWGLSSGKLNDNQPNVIAWEHVFS